ncbi:MAG: N-6 DNA methylase, partial [Anaerovibrio sp.]|uniref:N-6 DNA methylase n=1 Tax=Anaerovibrio sp. TaxID=1872532 RepID=UPI0026221FE8
MDILSEVVDKTKAYLESMPKKERKKRGQFFTSRSTAEYMASLFCVSDKERITVLDPGAGTGILSAALVERLLAANEDISIELTCYETDEHVLPVLQENLRHMQTVCGNRLNVILLEKDYLLSQADTFNDTVLMDM